MIRELLEQMAWLLGQRIPDDNKVTEIAKITNQIIILQREKENLSPFSGEKEAQDERE